MKTLIFDINPRGHHFEYIKYEIEEAINKPDINFIFILAEGFQTYVNQLKFNIPQNVKIDYIKSQYLNNLSIWKRVKMLKSYFNKIKPDEILLNDLISYMPFLPFVIRKKKSVKGIIYLIPKYRNNPNFKTKLRDSILYRIFAKAKCFNKVFLLNDKKTPQLYNSKLKTSHFNYLPDPIYVQNELNQDILDNFSNQEKIILFHGGAETRKGTIDILEAYLSLDYKITDKFILIFGGSRPIHENAEKFLEYVNKLKVNMEIHFIDGFMTFQDLSSYVKISDYVILPYKNTAQSSGILGYAAFHNKPVIGPAEGLLGEIIRTYNLGMTVDNLNSEKIKITLERLNKKYEKEIDSLHYLEDNSIDKFKKTIFS